MNARNVRPDLELLVYYELGRRNKSKFELLVGIEDVIYVLIFRGRGHYGHWPLQEIFLVHWSVLR